MTNRALLIYLKKYFNLSSVRFRNLINGNCTLLLYHSINKNCSKNNFLTIEPDVFYQQMLFLKKNFNVLTVEEFENNIVQQARFPDKSVLISFDDGYKDNHYVARPILETLGMQALFFITTGYVKSQKEFWWDKLEQIVFNQTLKDSPLFFNDQIFFTNSLESRLSTFKRITEILKKTPPIERDYFIEKSSIQMGLTEMRDDYCAMNPVELRQFALSDAVVLGAHTINHPSLKHLNEDAQYFEIKDSLNEIYDLTGVVTNHFSIPFGTRDYFSDITIEICRNAGINYIYGDYHPVFSKLPPLAGTIPRYMVKDNSIDSFKRKMNSLNWYY